MQYKTGQHEFPSSLALKYHGVRRWGRPEMSDKVLKYYPATIFSLYFPFYLNSSYFGFAVSSNVKLYVNYSYLQMHSNKGFPKAFPHFGDKLAA